MTQQVETDLHPSPVAETRSTTTQPRRSLLLGLCGLFAVWVLVMPPFAGSDEFDHAYRAAAAARGQWAIDPVAATRGTGAFVTVPDRHRRGSAARVREPGLHRGPRLHRQARR